MSLAFVVPSSIGRFPSRSEPWASCRVGPHRACRRVRAGAFPVRRTCSGICLRVPLWLVPTWKLWLSLPSCRSVRRLRWGFPWKWGGRRLRVHPSSSSASPRTRWREGVGALPFGSVCRRVRPHGSLLRPRAREPWTIRPCFCRGNRARWGFPREGQSSLLSSLLLPLCGQLAGPL